MSDTASRSRSSREIIIDLFAGGGGASTGIYMATGKHPDVAINHSPNMRHLWLIPEPAFGFRPRGRR